MEVVLVTFDTTFLSWFPYRNRLLFDVMIVDSTGRLFHKYNCAQWERNRYYHLTLLYMWGKCLIPLYSFFSIHLESLFTFIKFLFDYIQITTPAIYFHSYANFSKLKKSLLNFLLYQFGAIETWVMRGDKKKQNWIYLLKIIYLFLHV